MILGLQVIGLIFALIMIYFAYLHYRRREINGIEISFWIIAWVGAIVIAIFPDVFRNFSARIAIFRAFDLAMIGGFILVIPMVYISYVRTKRMQKKIEDFIRENATKDIENDTKK